MLRTKSEASLSGAGLQPVLTAAPCQTCIKDDF